MTLSRFQTLNRHEVRTDFECRLRNGGDCARWVQMTFQPLSREGDGDWLCTCADIDQLKRREQTMESRIRLHTDLLNISQDCFKLISPEGDVIYMNRAGCQALGVSEDSAFGMQWLQLLPESVRVAGEEAIALARQGSISRFTGCSALPGEPLQTWDNVLTPIKGPDGRTKEIFCLSRETTAQRIAEDGLRQSQERLIVAARVSGMGIWDYDIATDALYCDDSWYNIVGLDPAQPLQRLADFSPYIHPEDVGRATEVRDTAAQLIAQEQDYSIVFRIVRPDGEIRWVRSAACMLQDLSGNATRAIGFLSDITDMLRGEMSLRNANRELEKERDSLAQQCLEDPLTGIANRRFLDSELSRICLRANRTHQHIAVGMIDIDHFKAYNDHYGHPAGDKVVRAIAGALKSIARQSDFVARYGGEEFAFALPSTNEPKPILERLMAAVEALAIPHEKSPTGRITISCGCIVRRGGGLMPATLLKAADDALYDAKSAGRDRYALGR